ncbi:unnamed protein product [Tetraodon nigroviridis]|uniref:(spotted green pufferfish) hypothetical protein n=1 Tax=Tetraodon nigroviridis TaxID=99883 RepID=Q4SYR3_TETNG|nr:unnamed protein product [Tetraodon nigroviridis]
MVLAMYNTLFCLLCFVSFTDANTSPTIDNFVYRVCEDTPKDSTAEGLFKISSSDGVISVASSIDREVTGDTVFLTVKATESKKDIHGVFANTTAQVQINIIDINDNKPEFYKCGDSCVKAAYFTGEVLEHSFGSISINMTVKDLDRVIAIDEEESTFRSNATVNITIKDINDNSPTFPKDSYKLSVPEHAPNGTVISNFTARDSENQTGSTELEITVTDINDQYPVINRDSYQVFVKEGAKCAVEIKIFTVDESYKVELEFTSSEQEVEEKLNEIIKFVTFGSLKI